MIPVQNFFYHLLAFPRFDISTLWNLKSSAGNIHRPYQYIFHARNIDKYHGHILKSYTLIINVRGCLSLHNSRPWVWISECCNIDWLVWCNGRRVQEECRNSAGAVHNFSAGSRATAGVEIHQSTLKMHELIWKKFVLSIKSGFSSIYWTVSPSSPQSLQRGVFNIECQMWVWWSNYYWSWWLCSHNYSLIY